MWGPFVLGVEGGGLQHDRRLDPRIGSMSVQEGLEELVFDRSLALEDERNASRFYRVFLSS